jgi:hypothetical protein
MVFDILEICPLFFVASPPVSPSPNGAEAYALISCLERGRRIERGLRPLSLAHSRLGDRERIWIPLPWEIGMNPSP